MSKPLLALAALFLLGGDDKPTPGLPLPVDPNLPPGLPPFVPTGIIETPPVVVPGLGDLPVPPGIGPIFPGVPTGPTTLGEIFAGLLTDTPTQGGLWAIEQGTSPNEVLDAAYGDHSPSTWQCFTASAWNWGLYAVEGGPGSSSQIVSNVLGTVTSAWFPMHENASNAIAQGRLPQRLVLWNKGSQGQVQPRAQSDLGQPQAGTKTWGTLFFPRKVDCGQNRFGAGKNPIALFNKLGIAPAEWNAWS